MESSPDAPFKNIPVRFFCELNVKLIQLVTELREAQEAVGFYGKRPPRKFGFLFIAHNAGRFDLPIIFRTLFDTVYERLEYALYQGRDLDGVAKQHRIPLVINAGRVMQFSMNFKHGISLSYRDSIQYVPTAARSLIGASLEMKVPGVLKLGVYYVMLDIVTELMSILYLLYHTPRFAHWLGVTHAADYPLAFGAVFKDVCPLRLG